MTVLVYKPYPYIICNDDIAATQEDTPVLIDVLANDYTIDGYFLTLVDVSTPHNGTAVIIEEKVEYTPDSGYVGTDTFMYLVTNGDTSCRATVTVTITGIKFYEYDFTIPVSKF